MRQRKEPRTLIVSLPTMKAVAADAPYTPPPGVQPEPPTFWRRTTEAPTRFDEPIVVVGQRDPFRDWGIRWPDPMWDLGDKRQWRFDMGHQTHWCYWTDILAAHPLTPWP